MQNETSEQQRNRRKLHAELKDKIAGKRTGAVPAQRSLYDALLWLLDKAALYGLDTPETAELIASASTEMETLPTPSTSDLVRTLTSTFAHWRRNGMTVSSEADMMQGFLNFVADGAAYRVKRDRRGRSYLVAEKVKP